MECNHSRGPSQNGNASEMPVPFRMLAHVTDIESSTSTSVEWLGHSSTARDLLTASCINLLGRPRIFTRNFQAIRLRYIIAHGTFRRLTRPVRSLLCPASVQPFQDPAASVGESFFLVCSGWAMSRDNRDRTPPFAIHPTLHVRDSPSRPLPDHATTYASLEESPAALLPLTLAPLGDEDLTAARAEQKRAMDAASDLTGTKSSKGGDKEDMDISLPGGGSLGAGGAKAKTAGVVVSVQQDPVRDGLRFAFNVRTSGFTREEVKDAALVFCAA